MRINAELDAFSHTVNPILGLAAVLMPLLRTYRRRMSYGWYYCGLVIVVAPAYLWMHFEREYKWWEHAWGVTFSTILVWWIARPMSRGSSSVPSGHTGTETGL